MKKNLKLWMLLVLVLNIVSCSDDCNEPALVTDPYPYPQEYLANKDLSVKTSGIWTAFPLCLTAPQWWKPCTCWRVAMSVY